MPTRPVWAEISLDRLIRNYHVLSRAAGNSTRLLAVVKADAYGHGLELCGPALAAAGARWLGVTSVEEGWALRRALGVLPAHLAAARILVMSSLWEGEAETVLDRQLTAQVWEPYQLRMLAEAARLRGLAAGSVRVHLEIDTGMARQGVSPRKGLTAMLRVLSGALGSVSEIAVEGVMTHFSAPEVLDGSETAAQMDLFREGLARLAGAGVWPRLIHAGNSATVFDAAHVAELAELAAGYNAELMLRPGLSLYGIPVRFTPGEPERLNQAALEPVLAWKTRSTSLRDLALGEGAGYNSTFRAARPTRLALVPVGYADGLNRLLSNQGAMLVRGRLAPIVGRISMDQTLLDVTDHDGAAIGDEVVILGEQGGQTISAWDHADLCGTIPYEILCNITARVPRRVAGDG